METPEKILEKILTIDGRGRPEKAKLLIELIATIGIDKVLVEVKKISERKFI